ncbi:MAG: lysine--tRNA ligase, partial [Bacteroidales bacterium]|nr:lysine--tRNA ligase [Bacteroidales bacterium]
MNENNLNEQEIVRRETLSKLYELGINPYPAEEFKFSHYSFDILNNFIDENPEKFNNVSLAGRIMSRRIMGNASFAELQDSSG